MAIDHTRIEFVKSLASLPPTARAQALMAVMAKIEREDSWEKIARPEQLPPLGDWRVWLILAGRGWGKTRTGAELVRQRVESGKWKRVALVAPTSADARDVMVEGESGILACCGGRRPVYEPSKRRLTWWNGAIGTTYSADEPDRLRGPQHDGAWCDEPAAWRYPATWDQLMFGLRLGSNPQVVATTTPRPTPLIKGLVKLPTTVVTKGSTYENRANLAPAFMEQIITRYQGTRLGRQELDAEILDDVPGALWQRDLIEQYRVESAPDLVRLVVAVDPSVGDATAEKIAECGIIVAGIGRNGHGYVLSDVSLHATPAEWAKRVVGAYRVHQADRIVAESNNGGEMVRLTIRTVDKNAPVKLVSAQRAKEARAEPVASLYEQGRIHHVGTFPELEDQLCTWVPGEGPSPDRLDALVWAFTELMVKGAVPLVAPQGVGHRRNPWLLN